MTLTITVFQDEDGMFIVECPAIPGCVSQFLSGKQVDLHDLEVARQGRSIDEAEQNIREAIAACLDVRRDEGLWEVLETREIDVPF